MKKSISIILIALAFNYAFAQTNTWKMTLNVVDEDGNPIADAKANVGYYTHSQPADISGLTDTNGIFVAKHSVEPSYGGYALGFWVDKNGYYSTRQDQLLPPTYNPEKWNQMVTLVLKKVGNPIPMYAKWVNTHVPALDKPIGYDLMAGDWVTPYGKGFNSDILFTGHFDKKDGGESDFALTVSFPNKEDGIQTFETTDADKASNKAGGLLSSHEAPVDGYQSQWIQTDNRKQGQVIETNRNADRNYFFRVRTILDDNGNIKSALYGKIYGDFMHFRYFLDPTPNDRNVEFDLKHNLIKDVKSFEQATDH